MASAPTDSDTIRFPDPRELQHLDVAHWGGAITTANLRAAYASGIFPWPSEHVPLPWCCPDPRAILDLDDLHVSKSLARLWNKHPYRISVNEAFAQVIAACSTAPRPNQESTWITAEMQEAYVALHREGFAHSIEVWDDAELVGGLYGVSIQGTFSGESMFHLRSNTSKLAVLQLVEICRSRGLGWIDIQMLTPLFESFGAKEISRDDFLERLRVVHARGVPLFER